MIQQEPRLRVGIFEGYPGATGEFYGEFTAPDGTTTSGAFSVVLEGTSLRVAAADGRVLARGTETRFTAAPGSRFTLNDVTIGVQFHWERKELQTFEGNVQFVVRPNGTLTAVNEVPLEQYLKSVISSEMSAEAPIELLRAHAITSRSWLVAMLDRAGRQNPAPPVGEIGGKIVKWYTREDHDIYDVCADDHCQRYQGVTKIISGAAEEAIESTRGLFLVYDNAVCDARFYKSCGGITEEFQNVWEDTPVPYLPAVSDAPAQYPPVLTEDEADRWVRSSPEAYCNTTDGNILRQILPSFDQETTDFYRWKVVYAREELEAIILKRSGMDFGTLMDLIPLKRGPSGRIYELKVVGTKKTVTVGKELEIRKWLSKSHLYSSAFIVETERGAKGIPVTFTLIGAGWGHGVGLCQIGASVMAVKGFEARAIVTHYFPNAELKKLY